MADKQNIIDKVVVEELLNMIIQNSTTITDEVVNKHYVSAVKEFAHDKINLKTFIDKCLACGLISTLHWNPTTYNSCKEHLFSDLEGFGVSVPSEIIKEGGLQ